jgi:hypothetical protein
MPESADVDSPPMKILKFEVHDDLRGWTLEPMQLTAFNLLVGVSGAGKTRIVRAIEQVCSVALGTRETEKIAEQARGSRFSIEIEHDARNVRWEAELEPPTSPRTQDNGSRSQAEEPLIRSERIIQGDRVLVDRTTERFLLNGAPIPRLDRAKSAIAMLKEDPSLCPLHAAFSRCIFRELELVPTHGIWSQEDIDEDRGRFRSPEALSAEIELPLHYKAELLQELFPDAFAEIEESFRDAFPSVRF